MRNRTDNRKRAFWPLLAHLVAGLAILGLVGCAAVGTSTPTVTPEMATPEPTPTRPPLPPLPGFTSPALLSGVTPTRYVTDTCEYLARRWDPNNSSPGTIVVPIMYHSVGKRANQGDGDTWTPTKYFNKTMAEAERLGFKTVTAGQVAGFLARNERIPPRSMIMFVDDRRLSTVKDYFLPVLERNDWTLTLAWISNPESRPDTWERLETMVDASGRLDVQAHGYRHKYMTDDASEATVREEILGPIPVLEEKFDRRPVAFIWPGGNYTAQTVRTAREAGYQLGFTVHSRGPIMYNWVPQGAPERAIGDPLLLLPRYWGYPGMATQFAVAAGIGDEARKAAQATYEDEALYYRTYCGGELPQ